MKHLKILFTILILFGLYFAANLHVQAADLTVNFTDTDCNLIPSGGPLFNELDVKPLDTYTKTIQVNNNGENPATFSLSLKDPGFLSQFFDSTPSLSDIIWVTIADADTQNVIYGPVKISTWKDAGYIVLASNMAANSVRNINFTVTVDNVGNEYQSKTLKYDMYINCKGGTGNIEDTDGDVLGEDDIRVLPETGLALSLLTNPLALVIFGIYLRRKKKQ